MAKVGPGQVHDINGVPIYPGDLLRTFHFQGARLKRHFLYHVAVYIDGHMMAHPVSWLEPSKRSGGGDCPLETLAAAESCEVISGYGPGKALDYNDRPKLKGARP